MPDTVADSTQTERVCVRTDEVTILACTQVLIRLTSPLKHSMFARSAVTNGTPISDSFLPTDPHWYYTVTEARKWWHGSSNGAKCIHRDPSGLPKLLYSLAVPARHDWTVSAPRTAQLLMYPIRNCAMCWMSRITRIFE